LGCLSVYAAEYPPNHTSAVLGVIALDSFYLFPEHCSIDKNDIGTDKGKKKMTQAGPPKTPATFGLILVGHAVKRG
jgi:hypothetical protein